MGCLIKEFLIPFRGFMFMFVNIIKGYDYIYGVLKNEIRAINCGYW